MAYYTWNSNWIRPMESGWSILEKFKYVNVITSRDLLRGFGTLAAKKSSDPKLGPKIGRIHTNLITFSGFNIENLKFILGVDIHYQTQDQLSRLIGMFPKKVTYDLLRDKLTYCRQCLTLGFYSLLHQFHFVHKCPYHLTELHDACLHCSKSMRFELPQHGHFGGFICNCSLSLLESSGLGTSLWGKQLVIQDKIINDWLNMNLELNNKLKTTYFYLPGLASNENALEFIMNYHKNDFNEYITSYFFDTAQPL